MALTRWGGVGVVLIALAVVFPRSAESKPKTMHEYFYGCAQNGRLVTCLKKKALIKKLKPTYQLGALIHECNNLKLGKRCYHQGLHMLKRGWISTARKAFARGCDLGYAAGCLLKAGMAAAASKESLSLLAKGCKLRKDPKHTDVCFQYGTELKHSGQARNARRAKRYLTSSCKRGYRLACLELNRRARLAAERVVRAKKRPWIMTTPRTEAPNPKCGSSCNAKGLRAWRRGDEPAARALFEAGCLADDYYACANAGHALFGSRLAKRRFGGYYPACTKGKVAMACFAAGRLFADAVASKVAKPLGNERSVAESATWELLATGCALGIAKACARGKQYLRDTLKGPLTWRPEKNKWRQQAARVALHACTLHPKACKPLRLVSNQTKAPRPNQKMVKSCWAGRSWSCILLATFLRVNLPMVKMPAKAATTPQLERFRSMGNSCANGSGRSCKKLERALLEFACKNGGANACAVLSGGLQVRRRSRASRRYAARACTLQLKAFCDIDKLIAFPPLKGW